MPKTQAPHSQPQPQNSIQSYGQEQRYIYGHRYIHRQNQEKQQCIPSKHTHSTHPGKQNINITNISHQNTKKSPVPAIPPKKYIPPISIPHLKQPNSSTTTDARTHTSTNTSNDSSTHHHKYNKDGGWDFVKGRGVLEQDEEQEQEQEVQDQDEMVTERYRGGCGLGTVGGFASSCRGVLSKLLNQKTQRMFPNPISQQPPPISTTQTQNSDKQTQTPPFLSTTPELEPEHQTHVNLAHIKNKLKQELRMEMEMELRKEIEGYQGRLIEIVEAVYRLRETVQLLDEGSEGGCEGYGTPQTPLNPSTHTNTQTNNSNPITQCKKQIQLFLSSIQSVSSGFCPAATSPKQGSLGRKIGVACRKCGEGNLSVVECGGSGIGQSMREELCGSVIHSSQGKIRPFSINSVDNNGDTEVNTDTNVNMQTKNNTNTIDNNQNKQKENKANKNIQESNQKVKSGHYNDFIQIYSKFQDVYRFMMELLFFYVVAGKQTTPTNNPKQPINPSQTKLTNKIHSLYKTYKTIKIPLESSTPTALNNYINQKDSKITKFPSNSDNNNNKNTLEGENYEHTAATDYDWRKLAHFVGVCVRGVREVRQLWGNSVL